MNEITTYTVYHPYGGIVNHDCKRGEYMYNLVAMINAKSLEDCFFMAQNDWPEYGRMGLRSTSVGDIIAVDDGDIFGKYYMITGRGFVEVPHTVVSYIDWGIIHQDKNHHDGPKYDVFILDEETHEHIRVHENLDFDSAVQKRYLLQSEGHVATIQDATEQLEYWY